MRDWHVGYLERPAVDDLWVDVHDGHDAIWVPVFGQLAPCDVCGERTCVNWRAEVFPVVPDAADVVFVCVGDKDTHDVSAALFEPCDVGQDDIHARCRVHVRECDPKIDNDQFLFAWLAVAIDVGVHANFASPTKGQID